MFLVLFWYVLVLIGLELLVMTQKLFDLLETFSIFLCKCRMQEKIITLNAVSWQQSCLYCYVKHWRYGPTQAQTQNLTFTLRSTFCVKTAEGPYKGQDKNAHFLFSVTEEEKSELLFSLIVWSHHVIVLISKRDKGSGKARIFIGTSGCGGLWLLLWRKK